MALLSSPYFLIVFAVYGQQHGFSLKPEQEKKLRRWFLSANTKGRYSRGSSESLLDQDLGSILKGQDVDGMLDNLKQQFGRIEIEKNDLVGRSQRSGLFKTMFLVFRDDGAKDWHTRLAISLNHKGAQHQLEFHHIFPKAYLSKDFDKGQINDIANLSFIGGGTNRKISDKAPIDYFGKILEEHGSTMFEKQCVPYDLQLLEKQSYLEFLDQRRDLIAKRLNQFILE